jgi:ubiquinone/menaquinone biosynthesis C-methylase UbiE
MNSNYFRQLAAKYDAWFSTPHGTYVQSYEHAMIMDLAEVKSGMKIADIGCGTGIYTRELCAKGALVTGVDISPEMLAIAAEKTGEYSAQVNFVEGDAASLPFDDNSFDMVFSITAMEFFEQPRICLHEMHRILRPGGHMVVATLNSVSLWAVQRRLKSWFEQTIFSHAQFHSIADMRRYLNPLAISAWRGGIFVPPFAPECIMKKRDAIEKWGQRHFPYFGAFIVVRVDK